MDNGKMAKKLSKKCGATVVNIDGSSKNSRQRRKRCILMTGHRGRHPKLLIPSTSRYHPVLYGERADSRSEGGFA